MAQTATKVERDARANAFEVCLVIEASRAAVGGRVGPDGSGRDGTAWPTLSLRF